MLHDEVEHSEEEPLDCDELGLVGDVDLGHLHGSDLPRVVDQETHLSDRYDVSHDDGRVIQEGTDLVELIRRPCKVIKPTHVLLLKRHNDKKIRYKIRQKPQNRQRHDNIDASVSYNALFSLHSGELELVSEELLLLLELLLLVTGRAVLGVEVHGRVLVVGATRELLVELVH